MIFKLWFMAIMIYVVSTGANTTWGMIAEEKTGKAKLFVACIAITAISLIYIPILYWSYMWIWGMGN